MEEMIMFIDDHREHLGVEAICKVLPIAPSTYYHHKSIERDPAKASDRAKRDAFIMTRITHFVNGRVKVSQRAAQNVATLGLG
jgi:hypothetical protein